MAAVGAQAQRPAAIDPGSVAAFLGSTPLFATVEPRIVQQIAPRVEVADHAPQSFIMHAGDAASGIALLMRGRATVRVVDATTGDSAVRETLRVGDHFGEVAALLGAAQPHAIVAEEACTVMRVPKDLVEQLSAKVPGFAHALARRLAARLVQASVMGVRQKASPETPAQPMPAAGPGVIPFVQTADYEITPALLSMVPTRLIQQRQILPLALRGKKLTVGMVNPHDAGAVADVRRVLYTVDPEIAALSFDDFNHTIVRLKLDPGRGEGKKAGTVDPDSLQYDVQDAEREADKAVRIVGDEVISLVNRMIAAAIEREASDIHVEAQQTGVRVRFRVHGMLHDWSELVAASFHKSIVARIKILAGLDVAERRLPQDGRIGTRAGRREIDLRVSTLPSGRGEKIVMRLFEAASTMRPLEHIFLDPGTLAAVRKNLDRPFGAILVAGPTGSGKSSSLYAMLNERRKTRPDSAVVTVEDPIEYRLTGVTQVQVHDAVGLGFAQILRAMLRQDPDVIMVGEVRDEETAKIALEAAMSGHLLFSSIHANTALSVIQRLESLGVGRNVMAQSLALVLVQRLARRLCGSCVRLENVAPLLFETLIGRKIVEKSAPVPLPRPVGCEACAQTGFSGRVAVIETLQVTEEIRTALLAGSGLAEVFQLATDTNMLLPFHRYASFLMARKVIGPNETLLTVA